VWTILHQLTDIMRVISEAPFDVSSGCTLVLVSCVAPLTEVTIYPYIKHELQRQLISSQMLPQHKADARGGGAVLPLQPAVAFANIGELSIDVLICTMEAQLVARLDSDNVLPCVGNNAYQMQPPGLLATPMELYKVPGESCMQHPERL